jgi:hypothetical protein
MADRLVDDALRVASSDATGERAGGRPDTDVPTVVTIMPRPPATRRAAQPEPAHKATGAKPPAARRAALPEPAHKAAGAKPPARVLPRAAGNRLPSPTRPPRSMPVVASGVRAAPRARGLSASQPTQTTAIAAPPPPPAAAPPSASSAPDVPAPPGVAPGSPGRKAKHDPTLIVAPLPSPRDAAPERARSPSTRVIVDAELAGAVPVTGSPAVAAPAVPGAPALQITGAGAHRTPRADHKVRIGVGLVGVAIVVAVAISTAIGFSSDDMVPRPGSVAGEPVAREPTASPPARAAAAVEVAARASPPVDDVAIAAAPPPVDDVAIAAEPRTAGPETPGHRADATGSRSERMPARPARMRAKLASPSPARAGVAPEPVRGARPVSSRGKPARSLAYDPDALFLKKP